MHYLDLQRRILRVCAIFSMLASSAAYGGLIAHYKFDETTGATTAVNEVTANGGNGTIGANVGVGVAGKVGNAVKLNNDASQAGIVDMGNATSVFSKITTSGEYTISYWLKSSDTAANRSVAVFLGNNGASNDYIDSGIMGSGGQTDAPSGSAYGRHRKATNTPANIGDLFGPLINDGSFHHLALTVDTATAIGRFYVDGILIDSDTNTTRFGTFPTLNNLEVGRLGRSSPADPIDGSVDDLQIYDVAIGAYGIKFLYDNPGAVVPEPSAVASLAIAVGLIALWRRVVT